MRVIGLAMAACLATTAAMAAGFTVTSSNIRNRGMVPMAQVLDAGGCTGGNVSPQLTWSGEPAGTRSFAVTMFDPDAPTGRGWWHWTVFNIPPSVHDLAENAGAADRAALPPGAVEARNDFGFSFYGGPCPPPGNRPHRYVIAVYALNVPSLPLGPQASGEQLQADLRPHTIAGTFLTAYYGRR